MKIILGVAGFYRPFQNYPIFQHKYIFLLVFRSDYYQEPYFYLNPKFTIAIMFNTILLFFEIIIHIQDLIILHIPQRG